MDRLTSEAVISTPEGVCPAYGGERMPDADPTPTVEPVPMLSRERRAWVFDALLAVGFTVAVLGISHRIESTNNGERTLDALAYVCIAVAGVSLAWRRRFPRPWASSLRCRMGAPR